MQIEHHPFPPFIPDQAQILILGSFPCRQKESYGEWYYSGSGRSDFWNLLSSVYKMPAGNLEEKINLCRQNKIALSDVAHSIIRTKNNCSDSNLKIIQSNEEQIKSCLVSSLKKILCTGKYVATVFHRMFPKIDLPFFILPSPSPAANRYIAGLSDYRIKKQTIFEYKLEIYREMLTN